MNRLRNIISAIRGGPWIESTGTQVSSTVTRFEYPETITVSQNQRIESVTIYRADGSMINRVRIMPLIPQLWEDFKTWLDFKWWWHVHEKRRRFRK